MTFPIFLVADSHLHQKTCFHTNLKPVKISILTCKTGGV